MVGICSGVESNLRNLDESEVASLMQEMEQMEKWWCEENISLSLKSSACIEYNKDNLTEEEINSLMGTQFEDLDAMHKGWCDTKSPSELRISLACPMWAKERVRRLKQKDPTRKDL